VKEAAAYLGLEVAQPESRMELPRLLQDLAVDVGVVAAFGLILPPEVLALPRRGFLNVHFSLLPRWRGAAPVERAIMEGDQETGVTIMEMDEGLDTGPIVAQLPIPIGEDETGGELRERLSHVGGDLLAETLPAWVDGTISPTPQDDRKAIIAPRIGPEDRLLSVELPVREACNRVRALAPEPGARLSIDGEYHKILRCRRSPYAPPPGHWQEREGIPVVGLADGGLEITEIQPPGKRAMSGEAWLRGRDIPGTGP
ncbi:MAG: methionyl-tRNA formyltransferase, partial [Actinomycetota bacterium]